MLSFEVKKHLFNGPGIIRRDTDPDSAAAPRAATQYDTFSELINKSYVDPTTHQFPSSADTKHRCFEYTCLWTRATEPSPMTRLENFLILAPLKILATTLLHLASLVTAVRYLHQMITSRRRRRDCTFFVPLCSIDVTDLQLARYSIYRFRWILRQWSAFGIFTNH